MPLQGAQVRAPLVNLAQQRLPLGVEQLSVPSHQHRAPHPEHLALGAVGAHAGQPVVCQAAQLGVLHGQQVRVVGRHERADEVERGALHPVQVLPRVVALVEHQRDLLGPVGDLAAAPRQVGGEALEQGRVGAIAGIGAVQQRQARVGGDQQGDTDDAQGLAAFLAVAALG